MSAGSRPDSSTDRSQSRRAAVGVAGGAGRRLAHRRGSEREEAGTVELATPDGRVGDRAQHRAGAALGGLADERQEAETPLESPEPSVPRSVFDAPGWAATAIVGAPAAASRRCSSAVNRRLASLLWK